MLVLIGLIALLAPISVYFLYKDTVWFGKIRNMFELLTLLYHQRRHGYLNSGKIWSFVDFFEDKVDDNPDIVQFITVEDDKAITLGGMERQMNQLARWGQSLKLKQHDTVAVVMTNRPELVVFWLGMAKIGVRSSLVNSTVTGKSLMHCVELSVADSENKIAVIDSELKSSLSEEIAEMKRKGISVHFWDDVENATSSLDGSRVDRVYRNTVKERDPLIYIFTSGTTGLPKASKISSSRYLAGTLPGYVFLYMKPGDRFYNCLPLYHSAGGMLAIGGCMRAGATMVLRKKFSARSFTPDCIKYKCVAMQYIGELCRYLANAPPNPDDSKVRLRYAIGNGMRPDVWVKFKARYNVHRIVEFYAATEGNISCFNSAGQVGALGYMPYFADLLYPVKILRVDPEDKSVPVRSPEGLCVLADVNEVGLVCNLIDNKRLDRRFDGYSDSSATQRKIIRDVRRKGDQFFNSGDLLSRDEQGFFYWSDRVGDTFRWKGENVATTEVENVLDAVPGFADVTVYGVTVPDYDGRVGMAAISLSEGMPVDKIDWTVFHSECTKHLTHYSRPAFLRIQETMAVTTTFKHQKTDLVKDGFDPSKVKNDKLFFYSQRDGKVLPLDKELFSKIEGGVVKL